MRHLNWLLVCPRVGKHMFRFIKKSALVLTTMAMAIPAANAGGSVDLSLSNKSFRASYGATAAQSGVHFDAAWLHHEDEGNRSEERRVGKECRSRCWR